MKYAPLLLFTYNRAEKTQKILKNIEELIDANKTELFVFCDGAKNEEDINKVKETRRVINEWKNQQKTIKSVQIVEKDHNYGLADSIISGVTTIIKEKQRVIVLEDDFEISKDFLVYMNRGLEYYSHTSNIWSISGYTPVDCDNQESDVYFSERAHCWGWATWEDRWNLVDWNVTDYPKIKYNLIKRYGFAKWGNDLPTMLDSQQFGLINSWYVRWTYAAYKNHMLTVYPIKTLVANYGMDGSGTNCNGGNVETQIKSSIDDIVFNRNIVIDNEIRKAYRGKTGPFWRREIKWFLIKLGILSPKVGVMNLSSNLRVSKNN